jgi:hypothetical protein
MVKVLTKKNGLKSRILTFKLISDSSESVGKSGFLLIDMVSSFDVSARSEKFKYSSSSKVEKW